MNTKLDIEQVDTIINKTFELISLYNSYKFHIPPALKGDIGEFIIYKELISRFPDNKTIKYKGGQYPGYDIILDKIRIQVKTQFFKDKTHEFTDGRYVTFESSPDINKSISDKCDILILVIIYPNDKISDINSINIYIFNKCEFDCFNTKGCWGGKKGNKTIFNFLKIIGEPTKKWKEIIAFYDTPKYKELFKTSKDAWHKIQSLITK